MRILVVTGSSGGHIFPATALLERFREKPIQALLVLPRKAKENKIPINWENVSYIHDSKITLKLEKNNIKAIIGFFIAAWESLVIIVKFKPDVVVGFGSQNTLTLIFLAWLFRINTLIHEQNVIPGRANRFLSRIADKIALTFSQTQEFLKAPGYKVRITGNPLRADLKILNKSQALEFFGFNKGKLTVLVTGGSQGSHKLNESCFKAFENFSFKDSLQIIHICGTADFSGLKEKYSRTGLAFKLFDFLQDMQYAYCASDLVISRSGATTVAELEKFMCPAVLVPYPFAYRHQLANAKVLEEAGQAVIINDEELSPEKINASLKKFLEDKEKLTNIRRSYCSRQTCAVELLEQEVLNFFQ